MPATENVDELICALAEMDRPTLIQQFISYRSRFPVDLTADYLDTLCADRIRHVFLAMCLQNQRRSAV
jgi:hypothetical protein